MSKEIEALKCVGCHLAREVGELCVCECACRYVTVRENQRTMEGRDTQRDKETEKFGEYLGCR